ERGVDRGPQELTQALDRALPAEGLQTDRLIHGGRFPDCGWQGAAQARQINGRNSTTAGSGLTRREWLDLAGLGREVAAHRSALSAVLPAYRACGPSSSS